MIKNKSVAQDDAALSIRIPQRMSPIAKAKLHEFIDALVEVAPPDGPGLPDSGPLGDCAKRFIESLRRNKNPKLLRYLAAVYAADSNGVTLKEIGNKTGASRNELGGISSAVTRIWRKLRGKKEEIVIKEFHKHYMNPEFKDQIGKHF